MRALKPQNLLVAQIPTRMKDLYSGVLTNVVEAGVVKTRHLVSRVQYIRNPSQKHRVLTLNS
jgi:hypothetical protein